MEKLPGEQRVSTEESEGIGHANKEKSIPIATVELIWEGSGVLKEQSHMIVGR